MSFLSAVVRIFAHFQCYESWMGRRKLCPFSPLPRLPSSLFVIIENVPHPLMSKPSDCHKQNRWIPSTVAPRFESLHGVSEGRIMAKRCYLFSVIWQFDFFLLLWTRASSSTQKSAFKLKNFSLAPASVMVTSVCSIHSLIPQLFSALSRRQKVFVTFAWCETINSERLVDGFIHFFPR